MGAVIAFFAEDLTEPGVMVSAVILALLFLSVVIIIGRQPQSSAKLSFKVEDRLILKKLYENIMYLDII